MRKEIKKIWDKINSFKRARDKTVDDVGKKITKKIRRLRKYRYCITREGRIKFEITIDRDYGEENLS